MPTWRACPGPRQRSRRRPAGPTGVADAASPNRSPTTASPTPTTVERSQWERVVLAPDVELHIRRPLSRTQNKRVDRLVTIARELLEEDRS